jgi:deoxyribodipyrimidine photo-lyase
VPDLATLLKPNPRIRELRPGEPDPEGRSVVYWMQRAQRGVDNLALNHAIKLGNALKLLVLAVFGLTPDYPDGQRRHYRFLVEGLVDTQRDMEGKGVPLVVRIGTPNDVAAQVATEAKAAIVVGDENPVKVGQIWRNALGTALKVPIRLVDADVVVPTSLFPKEEFAARTIRPKIHRVWDEYLKPMTNPKASIAWEEESIPPGEVIDPDALMEKLKVGGVGEVAGYLGGTVEAIRRLKRFLKERLPVYATERNEPTKPIKSVSTRCLRN